MIWNTTQLRTTQDTKRTLGTKEMGKEGGGKKLTSPDSAAGAFSVSNTDLGGRLVWYLWCQHGKIENKNRKSKRTGLMRDIKNGQRRG